jgi:hypothetical protein
MIRGRDHDVLCPLAYGRSWVTLAPSQRCSLFHVLVRFDGCSFSSYVREPHAQRGRPSPVRARGRRMWLRCSAA